MKVKPVKLRRSIYIRVPNDIADLIGVNPEANFTLRLVEREDEFLLIYSVVKNTTNVDNVTLNAVASPIPQSTSSQSRPCIIGV